MNKGFRVLMLMLGAFYLCTIPAIEHAQSPNEDKVYAVDEVDVRAKIKNRLEYLPERKGDCPDAVHVSLRVVLRKSGEVTDIRVTKPSGCSYDQEAIKAV